MLKEFFNVIKDNTLPPKVQANGLDYVLQDGSYVLADDPEIIKQKNELLKDIQVIENEITLTNLNNEKQNKLLNLQTLLATHPFKMSTEALQLQLKEIKLNTELQNKEYFIEKAHIDAQITTEQAKNELRNLKTKRSEKFTSINSFIEFIKHESGKFNPVGKDYFIMLNSCGGKFITDFERPKDYFSFERQFSAVYQRLSKVAEGRTVNQKQLLEFVLENKNYIEAFAEVFNCYKKISQSKSSKFASEPIITGEGPMEERFEIAQSWEYNNEIKKEKLTLIPLINMKIPVIYMGEQKYDVEIYITPMKGPDDSMLFEIYAPGIEYTLLTALKDELDYAKEELIDLTEAFIALEN